MSFTSKPLLTASAAALAIAILAPSAFAEGDVTFLGALEADERNLVVASSDRGVVFIGADNAVFRAFANQQTAPEGIEQPALWVEDVDGDGHDEVVGAGSPSFVIDNNGDPMWGILSGCRQFFLGDFVDSTTPEVFCLGERTAIVRAWDGQDYYEWEGSGQNITACYMSDYDGDMKQEVACDLTNGSHLMFDLNYDTPEEREGTAEQPMGQEGVDIEGMAAIAAGTDTVTWNGGAATLTLAGNNLSIAIDGAPVGTVTVGGPIFSAVVADLDEDGTEELYVGGSDEVYIIASDYTLAATVSANPEGMDRSGVVGVRTATANGLEQSDRDAVRAQVEAGLSDVQECYDDSIGDDPYTRVGTMVFQIRVDGGGDISSVQRRHTDIQNEGLSVCIYEALEEIEFSPATEDSGLVSLTLDFSFVDAP